MTILQQAALWYFGLLGTVTLLTMRDYHREVTLQRQVHEIASFLFIAPFLVVALALYGAFAGLRDLFRGALAWLK